MVNKLGQQVQGDAKKLRDDMQWLQKLRSKDKVHLEKIKGLEDQIVYQELPVYNQHENLRFLGVPESMADKEHMKEVIYKHLEWDISNEEVVKTEFQRIHRIGKKSSEAIPILPHFLHF